MTTPDLRVYLVTDPSFGDVDAVVRAAVAGGVTCVQVRAKDATSAERAALAARLRRDLPAAVAVIVDDDLEAARHADGVHVGVDDVPPAVARDALGPDAVVGWSVNDLAQLDDAAALAACDYVAASPVWTTPTKPDADRPWGLDGVADVVDASPLPVVGIGGIDVGNAAAVVAAGAAGVAVVSAIGAADDPRTAAHVLRTVVDHAIAARGDLR